MRRLLAIVVLAVAPVLLVACTPVVGGPLASEAPPVSAAAPATATSGPTTPTPAPAEPVTQSPAATQTPAEATQDEAGLLPAFTYHHVSPELDNFICVTPETFDRQLQTIEDLGYTPVTATQLERALNHGEPLPDKPVMITFDDAWSNQYRHALPVLRKHGFKATFFVYPKVVGAGAFMDAGQLRELTRAGHDVQSHSWGHVPAVREGAETDKQFARRYRPQLDKPAEWIDAKLGDAPTSFAYPYGYYETLSEQLVSDAGYRVAFTIDERINRLEGDDPLLLGRFTVFRANAPDLFAAQLAGRPLAGSVPSPAPRAHVDGPKVTVACATTERVESGSAELLIDTVPVAARVSTGADGVTRIATTTRLKSGFHYVAVRVRAVGGQECYDGWGFNVR